MSYRAGDRLEVGDGVWLYSGAILFKYPPPPGRGTVYLGTMRRDAVVNQEVPLEDFYPTVAP